MGLLIDFVLPLGAATALGVALVFLGPLIQRHW